MKKKIKTWKIKVNKNIPFLYIVVYQRLLEKCVESHKVNPIIQFSLFRQLLSAYFHVGKKSWFKIAKELEKFNLIEIIPNCGIRLKKRKSSKQK